jgi:hypothetical protein
LIVCSRLKAKPASVPVDASANEKAEALTASAPQRVANARPRE